MTILQKTAYVFALAAGLFAAANSAFAQGAPLFAVLNGGNECSNASPPLCRQGDLDGYGSATVIFPTATSICFGITVNNLDKPTAAHIHRGPSSVNGGIVIPLTQPATGAPGASSGCKDGILAGTVTAIRSDPTLFYVNVHTAAFPNGAVRGQLH